MHLLIAFVITILVGLFFIRIYQSKLKENEKKGIKNETLLEKNKRKEDEKIKELREKPLNLSSERILLRPVIIPDKKPLSVIFSNKQVAQALNREPIKKVSEMTKILKEDYIDHIGKYTIEVLSSRNIIGVCSLEEIKPEEFQIEIILGRNYWGRDYSQEVLNTLTEEAKNQGAKIIYAPVEKNNIRAIKFFEKNGFILKDDKLIKTV